jgi:Tfp pilus assembly protein FimT
MSHAKRTSGGFTIIELMLAMSFIAALLVAIAMTTIQISKIYTKGLTLREVNQVSRAVSEDLQRTIGASTPFDVDPESDTARYVVQPGGGRLCAGRYSYAWNYGAALSDGPGSPSIYNNYNDGTPVRFAKVNDASASLCTVPTSNVKKDDATEMLTSGDRDLALHAFAITNSATDDATGQALYAISLTIGTNDQTQLVTNDSSCRPPSEGDGNEDYCSVNQFDIVVRAGNKSGGD